MAVWPCCLHSHCHLCHHYHLWLIDIFLQPLPLCTAHCATMSHGSCCDATECCHHRHLRFNITFALALSFNAVIFVELIGVRVAADVGGVLLSHPIPSLCCLFHAITTPVAIPVVICHLHHGPVIEAFSASFLVVICCLCTLLLLSPSLLSSIPCHCPCRCHFHVVIIDIVVVVSLSWYAVVAAACTMKRIPCKYVYVPSNFVQLQKEEGTRTPGRVHANDIFENLYS